jgi:cytochrome c-type biogenesis protein
VSLVVAVIALFGAGLTATLSPCVLPLVPGVVGVLVDGTHGERHGERHGGSVPGTSSGSGTVSQRSRGGATAMVLFSVGATAVFVVLGLGAGAIGASVGSRAQRVSGIVLIALSLLWVAGRRGRRVPSMRIVQHLPDSPGARALALGIGCGAAWTPCAGPLLGAALTAAGTSGAADGVATSGLLLAAYAMGVLSPFVALASFGLRRIPARMRTWGRVLAPLSAVVMFGLGVSLAAGWYESLVARLV